MNDTIKIGLPMEYEDDKNIIRTGMWLKEYEVEALEKRLNKYDKLQSNWNSLREWLEIKLSEPYQLKGPKNERISQQIIQDILDKIYELEGEKMFEDYYKLYEKCEKIKKPTYKKLLKIQEEWNKLTVKYTKDFKSEDLTTMWTLLNDELCDSNNYFNNFVSYLNYSSDRMNLNRWCRLQLLLGNAVDKLYELEGNEHEQKNN